MVRGGVGKKRLAFLALLVLEVLHGSESSGSSDGFVSEATGVVRLLNIVIRGLSVVYPASVQYSSPKQQSNINVPQPNILNIYDKKD